jgi:hypothetical protein
MYKYDLVSYFQWISGSKRKVKDTIFEC